MAHSPSHRTAHSVSQPGFQLQEDPTPTPKQQRRMTSPASNSSLNPPQEARRQLARPPSPLRNAYIPNTSTGIDPNDVTIDSDDEDDFVNAHHHRTDTSVSPSSSVSNLAASFRERVGNFLGSMTPRSPVSGSMLSDAELEAEAERARERSRREAERILTREAEERKRVEERVLAMMGSTRSLPPPPSRTQSLPAPPSPSHSYNEKEKESWWTAAKHRLTPTREKDLTPAQQIIQETKTREKESKKAKGKEREQPQPRYSDPVALVPPPLRKPAPPSPSTPSPSRPSSSNMPPNLSPSPMRSSENLSRSSPSRETPPLYAQFTPQGTLDVPGTLLTIVRRFEKLEKWTVGHVRALEERMSDVERWLVDKEKEREKNGALTSPHELDDVKDGIAELQGRVTELGREMARLATSPSNLSSGPTSQHHGPVSVAPHTPSSLVLHDDPSAHPNLSSSEAHSSPITPSVHSRFSTTARESTSPPIASSARTVSGTRLPYPTGDYASQSDTDPSPTHSPPASLTRRTTRPLSIANGRASAVGLGISTPSATPPPARSSPVNAATGSRTQLKQVPQAQRPTSVSPSPTPRKRYTVALGEPIVSPPDFGEPLGTAFFSTWDGNGSAAREDGDEKRNGNGKHTKDDSLSRRYPSKGPSYDEDDDEEKKKEELEEETIGKRSSLRYTAPLASAPDATSPSPSQISKRRLRAQSAYAGFANLQLPPDLGDGSTKMSSTGASVTPLQPRLRSRSSERLVGSASSSHVLGDGEAAVFGVPGNGGPGGRFVDPLVLRRQEKEEKGKSVAAPRPVVGKKVAVGQLVAFFDEKKG